jgi:hypothetical protein
MRNVKGKASIVAIAQGLANLVYCVNLRVADGDLMVFQAPAYARQRPRSGGVSTNNSRLFNVQSGISA